MFADPQSGSQISIQSKEYTFLETPNAPGIVYAEIGKKAKVYRLHQAQGGQYYAFKVFKPRYQNPGTVSNTQKIAAYKDVPGLSVVQRTVITPEQHPDLVALQKHYAYAILMPWIEGKSWFNLLSARMPLSQKDSLSLAHALISVMAGLEERGLAHCDLSSSNFLFSDDFRKVELVDIEDMFGPGLEQPKDLPAGTSGYAPGWVKQNGLWEAGADRFSTAMLLGEILAWPFEDIRAASEGDAFFADGEFGNKSKRLQLMSKRLEGIDPGLARLFQTAWYAESSEECPRIADWQKALAESRSAFPPKTKANPQKAQIEAGAIDGLVNSMFQTFQAAVARRNWEEAQKLQQAMAVMAPDFDDPQRILEEAQRSDDLEEEAHQKLQEFAASLEQEETELASVRQAIEQQRVQIDEMQQALEQLDEEAQAREQLLGQSRSWLNQAQKYAEAGQWEDAILSLDGSFSAAANSPRRISIVAILVGIIAIALVIVGVSASSTGELSNGQFFWVIGILLGTTAISLALWSR